MPIVKTKKAMEELFPGKILEIQATDRGFKADLEAWTENAGHQFLGTIEENSVWKHYVQKASDVEEKQ